MKEVGSAYADGKGQRGVFLMDFRAYVKSWRLCQCWIWLCSRLGTKLAPTRVLKNIRFQWLSGVKDDMVYIGMCVAKTGGWGVPLISAERNEKTYCPHLSACTDLVRNRAARFLVPRYGVCYTFNFGPIYRQVKIFLGFSCKYIITPSRQKMLSVRFTLRCRQGPMLWS
jgi:hypothetical protein